MRSREQICIEKKIYDKLKAEGRSDYVALAVLARIEQEIKYLEATHDGARKEKSSKYACTCKAIHNVKEAIRRYWTDFYRYIRSIFKISQ